MSDDANPDKVEGDENKIDLSPNKQIYRSAAVDVSPVDAIEELVDNALDNWMRTSQRVDDIEIDIKADGGYTRVTDDTGGLSRDRIKHLFALGKTFQHEVNGAIGAYGIGAKKAIVRLGDDRVVKSRARGAEKGYGFTVDEDWLDSDDWSVTIEKFDDMGESKTELIMKTDERIWDDSILKQLQTQLGKTYKLFLDGSIPDAGRVNLKVNGDPIKPSNNPDWSYTPFDGLHPRRYENIELYPKSIDSPVRMDVTVGLMREGRENDSGTRIYCQDRLVTDNEYGEVGGYGKIGRNRIGSSDFTHHNNRLVVIVELNTKGDGSELPWDAQKSTIDPHHVVSRAMYHWLTRIVTPYFDAHKDKVKKAFVHPYKQDSEYAVNGGEIEVLDYSGQQNVNDKPNNDLDDIQRVMRLAEGYAEKGFKYYGDIEEAFKPAFDAHFENNYDPKEHDGMPVEEVPVRQNVDEDEQIDLKGQEEQLTDLVNSVSGAGPTKKETLMQAGYISLEDIADASINELSGADGVGRRLAKRLKEEAGNRLEDPDEDAHEDEAEKQGSDSDSPGIADDDENEPSLDGETVTASSTEDGTKGSVKPTATDDDSTGADSMMDSETTSDDGSNDTSQQSGLTGFEESGDGEIRVPVDFDQEEYDTIKQALNVEDDDVQAFGKAVRKQLLNIYGPLQTS
jgi:hypothetical protein